MTLTGSLESLLSREVLLEGENFDDHLVYFRKVLQSLERSHRGWVRGYIFNMTLDLWIQLTTRRE